MLITLTSQLRHGCFSGIACAYKRSSTEASRDRPMPFASNVQVILRRFLISVLLVFSAGVIHAKVVDLRVMTYNIHHARGVDGEVNPGRIAQVVSSASADLAALQEVDRGVERTQQLDLPHIIASNIGFSFAFGKNIDFQGGSYGNAILSRFPILESNNHHFKMLREGEQRGLLLAKIELDGGAVLFASTHIDYRPDNSERLSNVEEMITLADKHSDLPMILCGDFNDMPNGQVYFRLRERFTDVWDSVDNDKGFTYSSTRPTKRIDFIFVSDDIKVKKAKVLETQASDHLPLLVELEINFNNPNSNE